MPPTTGHFWGRVLASSVIATAAIVVSGFAAVLAAWAARRRQLDDHGRELLAELRKVLDEGAVAMGAAKRNFDRVYYLQRDEVQPKSPEAQAVSVDWRATMQEARVMDDRIAIRLGKSHEVYVAYVAWLATLRPLRRAARAYGDGTALSERLQEEQGEAHEAFEPARAVFIEAAQRRVDPTRRLT
jgi:hypothetical protein